MGAAALLLSGCTTVNEQGALQAVRSLVAERTPAAPVWYRDPRTRAEADLRVRALLARPLSPDAAIEVAFLRNPEIQASLASVGIAEADLAQAGRLANPTVSLVYLASRPDTEFARQIVFNLLSLIALGPRVEFARAQAERTRLQVALDIVLTANRVRRAWFEAVAARQRVALLERVLTNAGTAADLTARLVAAGNLSTLDQARAQSFKAEVATQLGTARLIEAATRERLTREMGLWGAELRYHLPGRLPSLPRAPRRLDAIERLALMYRLDIAASRQSLNAQFRNLGLTRTTAFLNTLNIGASSTKETTKQQEMTEAGVPVTRTETDVRSGPTLEFSIPIFDPGDVRVTRAEFQYLQSVERLKALAIEARSEARESYLAYRARFDLARHYANDRVPLAQKILDEELRRLNGMLVSIFELLTTSRQQVLTVLASLDAQRDFWLADAQLTAAVFLGRAGAAGAEAPTGGEPLTGGGEAATGGGGTSAPGNAATASAGGIGGAAD